MRDRLRKKGRVQPSGKSSDKCSGKVEATIRRGILWRLRTMVICVLKSGLTVFAKTCNRPRPN